MQMWLQFCKFHVPAKAVLAADRLSRVPVIDSLVAELKI